ncbi:MAG: hypothetical protein CR991_11820 [Proteobacteria bacterium]|nr:MAG: hypothetical protein CR991_11820 [Pseudomonadota bacterium]
MSPQYSQEKKITIGKIAMIMLTLKGMQFTELKQILIDQSIAKDDIVLRLAPPLNILFLVLLELDSLDESTSPPFEFKYNRFDEYFQELEEDNHYFLPSDYAVIKAEVLKRWQAMQIKFNASV